MTTLTDEQADTDGEWQRLSPRMLLVHPVIELGKAVPALAGIVLAGHANNGHGSIWGVVAAGVVALLSLSRWFTTRLRVSAEQVQLRRGLVRRRSISTRRDRIRTVDVTAHPLHRLLGLVRLSIGTGTSDRKDDGRLVLDGLTRTAADRLRDELLHRAPEAVASPTARELARLDRRWIRFGPFTLSGVITGVIIWGFLWRVQGESGIDLLHSGPLRSVTHELEDLPRAAAVALVALAVVVFVTVTSTIGYVLAFWGFRLVRHDGGTLQVTRGLVTTRATSIERRRLAGAEISEPLVLRAVGGARTLAVATGLRVGRGAERGGEVLLPPAPRAEAERVAALALDGSPAVTTALHAHGPAARRRRLARALGVALVLLALSLLGPWWLTAVAAALTAASVPLGLDRANNLGHAHVDAHLVTGWGSLVRRRVVLADDAVIGWNLRASWFQRRAGLVTITATTAAGRQGYTVTDLDPGDALAVVDAVTPGLLAPWRPTSP